MKKVLNVCLEKTDSKIISLLVSHIKKSLISEIPPLVVDIEKDDEQNWYRQSQNVNSSTINENKSSFYLWSGKNNLQIAIFGKTEEDQVSALSEILKNPILERNDGRKTNELAQTIVTRSLNENRFRLYSKAYFEISKRKCEVRVR